MLSKYLIAVLLHLGGADGESLLVSGYSSQMEIFTLGGSPTNRSLGKDSSWPVDANLTWLQLDKPNRLELGDSVYAIHEVFQFVGRDFNFPCKGFLVCPGHPPWEIRRGGQSLAERS